MNGQRGVPKANSRSKGQISGMLFKSDHRLQNSWTRRTIENTEFSRNGDTDIPSSLF